jgi:hypothetical protein
MNIQKTLNSLTSDFEKTVFNGRDDCEHFLIKLYGGSKKELLVKFGDELKHVVLRCSPASCLFWRKKPEIKHEAGRGFYLICRFTVLRSNRSKKSNIKIKPNQSPCQYGQYG